MAKVVIAGNAVVITSSMKLEDIRTIKKYYPDALVLQGGKYGQEPIFAIDVENNADGCGKINQYGASFAASTRNSENLATITLVCSGDVKGDIKEYVADKLGLAISRLNMLEETLPDILHVIETKKAQVIGSISIAQ